MNNAGVIPVLVPQPPMGVGSLTMDGAYFKANTDGFAQVIVVGVMHFSPGDYLDALNDLLGESYKPYLNTFLDPPEPRDLQPAAIRRGYVSLFFKKETP
jgi:hypothetical protein